MDHLSVNLYAADTLKSMISNLDYEYIKGEFNGENIFSVEITYEKRA